MSRNTHRSTLLAFVLMAILVVLPFSVANASTPSATTGGHAHQVASWQSLFDTVIGLFTGFWGQPDAAPSAGPVTAVRSAATAPSTPSGGPITTSTSTSPSTGTDAGPHVDPLGSN